MVCIDCVFNLQAIHDWKLALGVLVLVIIDVTILTIYTIADRNSLLAVSVDSIENQEDSRGAENVISCVIFACIKWLS